MTSDAKVGVLALGSLLLAGFALQPLARSLDRAECRPARATAEVGTALAGQAGVAVWGELRGLIADGLWLRTYAAWSRQDLSATRRWIRLVTTVDDRPVYFWVNGARMLAYDLPHWRLAADLGDGHGAARDARQVVEEQAAEAIDYLSAALRCHPDSAAVCVEMANIHLGLRKDAAAAARWYRRAAESTNAPHFAARMYAEMLCRMGRYREAHAWLCELHPRLSAADADAMPDVILMRIRRLEDLLALPDAERYSPQPQRDARAADAKMD